MAEIKSLQVNNVEIPVIYEYNENPPLFYITFVFNGAGSVSNGSNLGLSDMTSYILNEGTKKLGATKFAEQLEQKAITLVATSGLENLKITLAGIQSLQKDGILLLRDLLQAPNFTRAAFKKIQQDAFMSVLENEDDFDYKADELLKSMLFEGTPMEFPEEGTQESISKITLKDIERFYKKHINLESLSIIVGGKVAFDEVAKNLQDALKVLPNGEKVSIPKFSANDLMRDKRMLKETQQAYIYFGSPFYLKDLEKESALIKVATFVLGGSGFGSRMMEEIRVKRGLAYSAAMRIIASRNKSYTHGYLQTSIKNEEEAIKLVGELVNDFIENGITEQELKAAKQYLLGSEPLRNETLSNRLSTKFSNYYNKLPLDFNEQLLKDIESLTLKEVNAYIKSHKEIGKLSFAIVSADIEEEN